MVDLVQPIAVSKTGSHEDSVVAAATASIEAYHNTPGPTWAPWLSGIFTKSVRRATTSQLDAVTTSSGSRVCRGESVAIASWPRSYADFPKEWRKMQVQGTDFYRTGCWGDDNGGPLVSINNNVTMTSGKTAAQVAHALFMVYLDMDPASRDVWASDAYPFHVQERPVSDMVKACSGLYVVRDAGLTEIAPDTATVIAETR